MNLQSPLNSNSYDIIKNMDVALKKVDDHEIIDRLIIGKIKKFKYVDSLRVIKGVNIFGEDFRRTQFGPLTYLIYRVNDCLLLSKDILKKDDVTKMEFKSCDTICAGSSRMMGFMGFFDDALFDRVNADHEDFPSLIKGSIKGKIRLSDFEDAPLDDIEIGYAIDPKCGSAFPPLICMQNDRNLLILGAKMICKIFGDQKK